MIPVGSLTDRRGQQPLPAAIGSGESRSQKPVLADSRFRRGRFAGHHPQDGKTRPGWTTNRSVTTIGTTTTRHFQRRQRRRDGMSGCAALWSEPTPRSCRLGKGSRHTHASSTPTLIESTTIAASTVGFCACFQSSRIHPGGPRMIGRSVSLSLRVVAPVARLRCRVGQRWQTSRLEHRLAERYGA